MLTENMKTKTQDCGKKSNLLKKLRYLLFVSIQSDFVKIPEMGTFFIVHFLHKIEGYIHTFHETTKNCFLQKEFP